MQNSKLLVIGDLHAQLTNLDDTKRLFEVWCDLIKQHNVLRVVFLGDVYHTHAVVRQEVIQVVRDGMDSLKRLLPSQKNLIVLAGNHDGVSPHSVDVNAVRLTLDHLCTVVDHPSLDHLIIENDWGMAFMPYTYQPDEFTQQANQLDEHLHRMGANKTILFCHQPFQGAVYENGFGCDEPSPHPSDINFDHIIAGHIHKEQTIGKVWYIGTPRQVSVAEANQVKHVALIHMADQLVVEKIPMNQYTANFYDCTVDNQDILTVDQIDSVLRSLPIQTDRDTVRLKIATEDRDIIALLKERATQLLPEGVKLRIVQSPIPKTNPDVPVLQGAHQLNWREMFADYIQRCTSIPPERQERVLQEVWKIWTQKMG